MQKSLLTKESFTNYSRYEAAPQNKSLSKLQQPQPNFVAYHRLFESDLYCINDLSCRFDSPYQFAANYTEHFCINITRKGFFTFRGYKHTSEEWANRIVLEKPGGHFRVVQEEAGDGGCSIFSFTTEGYEAILQRIPGNRLCFFTDPDWFNVVINADAVADYLHYGILQRLRQGNVDRFEMDCLVMELAATVVDRVLGDNPLHQPPYSVRRNHLRTVEKAKEYMLEHFAQAISLKKLARHCHISEFHFTRTFKQICGYVPFEYLQQLRFQHAAALLGKTGLPIDDVAYQSGFSRPDYFAAAFHKKFGLSPTLFRQGLPQ